MFAARREHVEQVIRPALARGEWVICDRFTDATFAYQGGGHGVDAERIDDARANGCTPTAARPHAAVRRAAGGVARAPRRGAGKGRVLDKFEREAGAFFARVRDAYLARAAPSPRAFASSTRRAARDGAARARRDRRLAVSGEPDRRRRAPTLLARAAAMARGRCCASSVARRASWPHALLIAGSARHRQARARAALRAGAAVRDAARRRLRLRTMRRLPLCRRAASIPICASLEPLRSTTTARSSAVDTIASTACAR